MTLMQVDIIERERPQIADRRIDAPRALLMLENAVIRRGAVYTYENLNSCRYALYNAEFNELKDGDHAEQYAVGASCIVGEAFTSVGFSATDLARMDRAMGPFSAMQFMRTFPDWFVTEAAGAVFRRAQIAQDKGHPWGFAYHEGMRAAAYYDGGR